jgi:antibiotic biosynthesis monooxygenase (ABM) superfamily enzyme
LVYVIQLVYVKPGQERTFEEFEAVAIPLIAKYRGELLLRVRPGQESIIESTIDAPYEIHVVSFQSEDDFERFKRDEDRKKYLHLKEQSISKVLLIQGNALATDTGTVTELTKR